MIFFNSPLLTEPPDTAHYQSWINNGLPSQTLKHTQKRVEGANEILKS